MEAGEALGIAAQLAFALAGFTGVVVVFRSGPLHEWRPIDKLRLRIFLTNSVLPLTVCLLALFLLSIKPPPLWIWRACSGLAVAFLLPFGLMISKALRSVPSEEFKLRTGKFLFYLIGVLGTALTILQIYNCDPSV
jgi:drug/metabolite transporter (DMT)-like permease